MCIRDRLWYALNIPALLICHRAFCPVSYTHLCDYLHLLERWEKEYAPQTLEEAWNPLFVEALQKKPYTEYLLDILLSGSMEERACVVAEYGKEVRKIEQRISEFTASHPAGRHERSRSFSAGAER